MDSNLLTPTRQRVLERLKKLAEEGKLGQDRVLPNERDLALKLKVSRSTLRTVLQEMERQGLVHGGNGRARVLGQLGSAPESLMARTVCLLSHLAAFSNSDRFQLSGFLGFIGVGVLETLADANLNALTLCTKNLDETALNDLLMGRPRGCVAYTGGDWPGEMQRQVKRMTDAGIPVVSGLHPTPGLDSVDTDHAHGGAELTRWLIGRGCRRILRWWQTAPDVTVRPAWTAQRDQGHEQALRDAGLQPLDALWSRSLPYSGDPLERFHASVDQTAGKLIPYLSKTPRVDAIMAISDGQIFALAAACRRFGLEPGRDVHIVGYDNYWADCAERQWEPFVPEATVDKQNRRIGCELVELLQARIENRLPAEPQHRVVLPELVFPAHH
jgi:DNA-binding LacI/PurR family transcriptional regulator